VACPICSRRDAASHGSSRGLGCGAGRSREFRLGIDPDPPRPAIAFEIDVACLGGILFWSYVALVLAEPVATRRQRLLGLGAGLLVLIAFNLFRITTSIYVEGSSGVNIHDYFYFFNMAFVLCVWAIWLRIIRPKRRATAAKAV
jgi:exosortase/archaeosortase family protein